jgi:GNAT superfamily N-acetyltransferase
MSNIEIRRATEPDLTDVLALYGQPGMDDGRVLSMDDAVTLFRRMSAYPQYSIYLARMGAKSVGTFALLIMDNLAHAGSPSAVVEGVVVDEHWRGCGVGTEMMKFAMRVARQNRCYKLVLSSNLRRERAHEFYQRLGFKQHGVSFEVSVSDGERGAV